MFLFDSLIIDSPKRARHSQAGWDGFFPYYAGYPEGFARAILKSANLGDSAVIWDPWNGSGTTTFSAAQLGLRSRGFDLNPAMIVIARARLLPKSEADSLEPLAREMVKSVRADLRILNSDDTLLLWFEPSTAAAIRSLESRIRGQLVGDRTRGRDGIKLEHISGIAATFYVALFSVCRQLASPFRVSNPTWLRRPKKGEQLILADRKNVLAEFTANITSMANALSERDGDPFNEHTSSELVLADTTTTKISMASIDFVLTSPPYCTRIDYSAATRMELAVMHPLIKVDTVELGRQMIGSTRVPRNNIAENASWGDTCIRFLRNLKAHPSKASSGYYYKTHTDYFNKMTQSLSNIAHGIKPGGTAIFVVQDSYYKDIHNDLPTIISEMAETSGLQLKRRKDFKFQRSMAGINPHTRAYNRAAGATESVLCFEKPLGRLK